MEYNEYLPLDCIIDAHTHIAREMDPEVVLENLHSARARGAVIIGLPRFDSVLANLSIDQVKAEYSRAKKVLSRLHPSLAEDGPEGLYLTSLKLAARYSGSQPKPPLGDGLTVIAGVDLSLNRDKLLDTLENLASRGFNGFKVISTLYMKHLDDPGVEAVFEAASYLDVPVVVHAGCDPGVWELPAFCRYGDPSRLEGILKRYKDVPTVIAHMGGYSAFAPGVFTQEAISLARKYPNVYLDTSAVPGYVVRIAVKSLPQGKVIYGSDYPVIDGVDAAYFALIVWRALAAAGYSRKAIEEAFHGIAEELFEVRCVDWNATD